jgi:hypothetical protein
MKPLNMTAFVRLKANGANKPKRFHILAYSGGVLHVDGFPDGVVVDLSGLELPGAIPILIDHKKSVEATIGLTDNIHNDGSKLTLQGTITGQSPLAQQVIAQSTAGHTWQASVGVHTIEIEAIPAGKTATANGQTFMGPTEIARRSVLRETSILPMGADATTSVNLAASARRNLKGSAAMSFEDYCKSLGLDAATLTPEAAAALQTSFAATQAPAAAPMVAAPVAAAAPPAAMPTAAAGATVNVAATVAEFGAQLEANRKAMGAQFRKSAEIQAKASGFPNIIATAIEQDWSLDKVELEVIKAREIQARGTRATSFSGAQNTPENQPRIIEAAVCMARGIKDVEKQYEDKFLQAAHSQFRGNIGLQQIFLMAAAASGLGVSVGDKLSRSLMTDILRQINYGQGSGRDVQASGFTTVSLPGILSNIANKELLMGYEDEETEWKEISDIKSCSDFKTVTSYRLLDDMEYEELGPGGKIKHGKVGEETFTRSVKTYAKMFALTYQMAIDDDLGAFDDIRNRLGKGSLRKLKRIIWTTFLSNHTTFWTTDRTNYIEGGTTNLGTDGVGLALAVKAFRQRKSPLISGAEETTRLTLGGRPTKLVVPPELETIADQLYTARNTNAVKASDVNTHANKYRPIVVNELSDSGYGGGYSPAAFYVFGDSDKPVVTSFLNGKQTPTVESADADFDVLGLQFRGYHDFGSSQSEYMAGVKSKGQA